MKSAVVPDALTLLSRVRAALVRGVRRHYEKDGLLEMRVPVLVDATGACETVSNVLAVEETHGLLLTQTGQLALEHALDHADGVWCHTGSFRRETIDARHLCEFELIEEEISCRHPLVGKEAAHGNADAMFEVLLLRIASAIDAMLAEVLRSRCAELEQLGGEPARLAASRDAGFARVSYVEALAILADHGVRREWGADLTRADEELLLKAVAGTTELQRPTFVTHYPQELKFFNMKVDRGHPQTVHSVDLLLPGIGEAVGGAVREDDVDALRERFCRLMLPRLRERSGLTASAASAPFESYFEAVAGPRGAPHAGYGIGLERVLCYALDQRDIRRVSLPLMLGTVADWGVES